MGSKVTEEAEWNEVLEEAKQISMASYNLFHRLRAMEEKGIALNIENRPIDIVGMAGDASTHTHNLWIYIHHGIKSQNQDVSQERDGT